MDESRVETVTSIDGPGSAESRDLIQVLGIVIAFVILRLIFGGLNKAKWDELATFFILPSAMSAVNRILIGTGWAGWVRGICFSGILVVVIIALLACFAFLRGLAGP